MKRIAFASLAAAAALLAFGAHAADDGRRQLFNGKDKEGWKMVGPGEFKVEDGELVTYGGMGMLWFEKEKFGDCELKVVYKMTAENDNSGVFIRIPNEPKTAMQAVNEGIEVQIDNKDDEFHRTGCLYSFTKAKAMVSPKAGEWAEMLITLDGDHTIIKVNGEVVTDYKEGDEVKPKGKPFEPNRGPRPKMGFIGLQNHGGMAHVHFKEVSVKPLKK